jgi:hypothetical protein
MLSRARDYFATRPAPTPHQPPTQFRAPMIHPPGGTPAPSTFGTSDSISQIVSTDYSLSGNTLLIAWTEQSPTSAAVNANTGAKIRRVKLISLATDQLCVAFNATQLNSAVPPSPSQTLVDHRSSGSAYSSPKRRQSSFAGTNTPGTRPNSQCFSKSRAHLCLDTSDSQYGALPHQRAFAASQQSFQSFASLHSSAHHTSPPQDRRSRQRRKSNAPPPAPPFYLDPAYRAQQLYPSGPASPPHASVHTPSHGHAHSYSRGHGAPPVAISHSRRSSHGGYETAHQYPSPQMEVYADPRAGAPNVLRRRRTTSSAALPVPPPGLTHKRSYHGGEAASWGYPATTGYVPPPPHESRRRSRSASRAGKPHTIKFKRKGAEHGGLSLGEAMSGVRMSRRDRYPLREMHADDAMNILLKVTWPGCRSLTYSVPVSGRDGRVDLSSLVRRIARACHHFLDVSQSY